MWHAEGSLGLRDVKHAAQRTLGLLIFLALANLLSAEKPTGLRQRQAFFFVITRLYEPNLEAQESEWKPPKLMNVKLFSPVWSIHHPHLILHQSTTLRIIAL